MLEVVIAVRLLFLVGFILAVEVESSRTKTIEFGRKRIPKDKYEHNEIDKTIAMAGKKT